MNLNLILNSVPWIRDSELRIQDLGPGIWDSGSRTWDLHYLPISKQINKLAKTYLTQLNWTCPELGTAQPQLVFYFIHLDISNALCLLFIYMLYKILLMFIIINLKIHFQLLTVNHNIAEIFYCCCFTIVTFLKLVKIQLMHGV